MPWLLTPKTPFVVCCLAFHECSYSLLTPDGTQEVAAADMEGYGTSMGVAEHSINVNRTLFRGKAGK